MLSGLAVAEVEVEVPDLQLGIGNGYYDTATETVVTPSRHFVLNAYAAADAGVDETFIVVTSVVYDRGLDPEDFGSFHFNGRKITAAGMVFGMPPPGNDPAVTDDRGLDRLGLTEVWHVREEFHFDKARRTQLVNTRVTPQNMPVATLYGNGGNYLHYQSFGVSTLGLKDGYNLYFALYSDGEDKSTGTDIVGKYAPFSHDAATAYVGPRAQVPVVTSLPAASIAEPEILLLFVLALGGIGYGNKRTIVRAVRSVANRGRDS